ncbi:EAL domain-containing protein [Microbacterium sp.]|uniref:EAL domain-containing protein n=1 Tax=Microbacterium sp. TaxID=51671 RepID=UPI003F721893
MDETTALTRDLRAALAASQLAIAYQPQWDLASYAADPASPTPVMVEALSRWHHAEHGDVPPDVFIPLAEDGGFLDELDLHILGRAATQVARWRASGHDIGLAVNASPTRFTVPYAERVSRALEPTGLAPSAVTIEVTEVPPPQLRPTMNGAIELLHGAGISISVDDYGGGETTLDMLEWLPIDEVKIDRSLTQRPDAAADDAVARVVDIGIERGWRIVAEGIETVDDLDRSLRRRCDRGQGFLWGRPAMADDLERALARS